MKRRVRFLSTAAASYGSLVYDTGYYGWTLAACELAAAEKQTNYLQIPGRDGAVDLMAGLTGSVPRYKQRTLTIRLECSEGDRAHRTALIDELVNILDGYSMRIVLPDDPLRYIRGTVSVAVGYNDSNHCEITITALCDPWRIALNPVRYDIEASGTEQTILLKNGGRRRVVPRVAAYATAPDMPDITISSGSYTANLTDYSSFYADELKMDYRESHLVTFSGSGHLVIDWTEAIL